MRIGVLRGDLSKSLFLSDLESKSQISGSGNGAGSQNRYLSRPTTTGVEAALLASVAPAVVSSAAITFDLVIDATNDDLRIKLSAAASFTVVSIAQTTYTTIALLVTAVNVALAAAGVAATASAGTVADTLRITSNTKGTGSTVILDTVANGSTFNTPALLGAAGQTVTLPAASTIITATLPVDGPLDVSATAVRAISGLANATTAEVAAIAESIAPQFVETDAAKKSWLYGNIKGYRSASFNPDPRREPAITSAAAISVVADDGVTAFDVLTPIITTADKDTPGAGALRITGTGLLPYGLYAVRVIVTLASGVVIKLSQAQILAGGGDLSSTVINIPAALVPGIALTTTTARVQVNDMLSPAVALT